MRRQHIALRSPEQREWAAAIAPARISREKAVLENLSAVWHGRGWRRQHERVARRNRCDSSSYLLPSSACSSWVAADQQCKCIRLGVPHRANHGKPVTGVWHVQIRYKDIKGLCRDQLQSRCHGGGGDYLKSLVFKGHSHHVANGIVVVHKQDFIRNGSFGRSRPRKCNNASFGRSHTAPPHITNNDSITQVYPREVYKTEAQKLMHTFL